MKKTFARLGIIIGCAVATLAMAPMAFALSCPDDSHTPVVDAAVPATYTQTGLTEGSHCEACGTTLVKQEVVPVKALAKPTDVAAANKTAGIRVSWKGVTGATSYRVYRNGKLLTSTTSAGCTDDSAVAGKKYVYKVRAYADANYSALSASATSYRLTKVRIRGAIPGGSRFTARWRASSAAQKVTGYQVRYSASSSMASPAKKKVKGAKKTSRAVIISKDRRNTYYVQVRSYRTVKGVTYHGPWSSVRTVKLGSVKSLRKAANVKDYVYSKLAHGPKGPKYQKYIVLHDTEGSGSPRHFASFFASDGRLVASHFVVSRDGSVGQIVSMDKIAHHAGYGNAGHNRKFGTPKDGRDDMRGTKSIGSSCPDYGMNAWSIGIEMEHLHGTGYTSAQLKSLDRLIAYIDAYYGFESKIIDHKAWRAGNSDTDSSFKAYLASYKKYRTHTKPAA